MLLQDTALRNVWYSSCFTDPLSFHSRKLTFEEISTNIGKAVRNLFFSKSRDFHLIRWIRRLGSKLRKMFVIGQEFRKTQVSHKYPLRALHILSDQVLTWHYLQFCQCLLIFQTWIYHRGGQLGIQSHLWFT